MPILCTCYHACNFLIVLGWLVSFFFFWFLKDRFSKNIETQARLFIYYVLITAVVLLLWIGDSFIPDDYLSNLVTEIIGIAVTVFLIDRIYRYISNKNEQLYRKLALSTCRMPIYTYCAYWLSIFEQDNHKRNEVLARYNTLDDFFTSEEFTSKVKSFDFNKYIDQNRTYAQYFDEKMTEIKDRFQSILVKYASKLSHKDITLLEHFGGKSYMFTVFAVMKFISEVKFTHQDNDEAPQEIKPFNNCFKEVSNENFSKHFQRLIELIDEYNNSVSNDFERWTLKNIGSLNTIASANKNPLAEW